MMTFSSLLVRNEKNPLALLLNVGAGLGFGVEWIEVSTPRQASPLAPGSGGNAFAWNELKRH